MKPSSAPPAGMFSSLLDRDTSGPRAGAPAAARAAGKPSVDYACIYTFLGARLPPVLCALHVGSSRRCPPAHDSPA